jgi:hypothetical protein
VKSPPTASTKPPSNGGLGAAMDPPEWGGLLCFSTLVTIGAVVAAVVVGACWGGLASILVALAIAGAICLIGWLVTLVFVVPLAFFDWLGRSTDRSIRPKMTPKRSVIRGGVADDWLDGPI